MVSKRKLLSLILAFWLTIFGVPAGAQSVGDEDAFWKSVRKGNVVEEYEIYLQQYPKGKYVAEARRRIGQLAAPGVAKPAAGDQPQRVESGDDSFDQGLAAYNRKDYPEALRHFRKAADQEDARAQFNLGGIYSQGQGVPQDFKEAVKWYRKAAEQGYAGAQYFLGSMYNNGQGVPQDYKEAVKWFRLAADQGLYFAQTILGLMYIQGQGVAANRVVAYALVNLSAATDPNSNKARTLMGADLSAGEIEAAQTLTREIAKPGNLLIAIDTYTQK